MTSFLLKMQKDQDVHGVSFDKCDCGHLEWGWNDKVFFDTIVLRVFILSLSLI